MSLSMLGRLSADAVLRKKAGRHGRRSKMSLLVACSAVSLSAI